jgi:hypothetical protein
MGNIFEHCCNAWEVFLGHCFNVWETYLNIFLMHGKHLGHRFNAQETFGTVLMYGKHF